MSAVLRRSLSVDLDFHIAVACDRVSSTTIHHGGHTLRELYFQLHERIRPHDALSLSFSLSPCDEEETGERRVADARKGWHFVLGPHD